MTLVDISGTKRRNIEKLKVVMWGYGLDGSGGRHL